MREEQLRQQFTLHPLKDKKKRKEIHQYKAIRYQKYDTLKQQTIGGNKQIIQTDAKFLQSIRLIAKTQESILQEFKSLTSSNLSDRQCEEIHYKGKRHYDANKFNTNSGLTKEDKDKDYTLREYFCECGCQRFKGEQFSLSTQIQSLPILGQGIILYFYLIKMLVINLVIFLSIYSIFALVTNLMQTNLIKDEKCLDDSYCNFRNNASDRSKFDDAELNTIEQWLGVGGMFIVMFLTRFVRIIGIAKDKKINNNLKSSSDFALKFSSLPDGQYNEEDLLEYIEKLLQSKYLQDLSQQLKKKYKKQFEDVIYDIILKQNNAKNDFSQQILKQVYENNKIEQRKKDLFNMLILQKIKQQFEKTANKKLIKSIQIIYNMQFSRKLIQKLIMGSYQIKYMIKQKNNKAVVQDKKKYEQKKMQLITTYELFQDLRKKFLSDPQFRKKLSTKSAIVQFFNEEDKDYFKSQFGSQNVTFYKYARDRILGKCCKKENKRIFKGTIPQIITAPEPTDIIWINCQKKQSISRILLIYLATFLIILVSLGIMVGLSYLKLYVLRKQQHQIPSGFTKESLTTFINIMITVCMQVINAILWILLEILLELQYNYTHTNKIISQMNKSSMAVSINIIALPLLVNILINDYQYYGAEGLSSVVYDYHISAIAIGLLLKFVNPANLVVKIIISIKGLRNYFIKARYNKKKPDDKIQDQQMKKIYQFYQAPNFIIAQYYTFIITNVLHACFFAPLQPILIIFASIQVFLFYWISKHKVLSECKIPQLTQRLIFDVALYLVMLMPAFFGAGSIINSYIVNHIYPFRPFMPVPGAICIALGILNYSNPGNIFGGIINYIIIKCCLSNQQNKKSVNVKLERVQNYYKNSNSLTLLGFEKCVLGNVQQQDIENQLKNYCCSHQRKQMQQFASEKINLNESLDSQQSDSFDNNSGDVKSMVE